MTDVEQLRQNIAVLEAVITQLRDENVWLREMVAKTLEHLMDGDEYEDAVAEDQ
jgi:hypothetical protein